MSSWWQGVSEDFSGLPDVSAALRVAVRLAVAALLGGLIGLERERRGKDAGMRTHMLVALGAALFVLGVHQAGASPEHLTRVIQGVAEGIGFVGGGAILKLGGAQHVRGLTTAASVWLTAAVGVAAGLGQLAMAGLAVALALIILTVAQRMEPCLNGSGIAAPAANAKGGHPIEGERGQ